MSRPLSLTVNLCFLASGLVVSMAAPAAAVLPTATWIGTTSNDIEDPANWNPASVPGSSNIAVFDSTVSGVNLTPTEDSADFNVSAFQFSNAASPFIINVNNEMLTFTGAGITGTNTNAIINVVDTYFNSIQGQLAFTSGSSASSGAAIITVANSGTQSGTVSGTFLGAVSDAQFFAAPAFTIGSGGELTVANIGTDSSTGTGGNATGIISSNQAQFSDTLTVGDGSSISISNTGHYTGSNSSSGNTVGLVNGRQLMVGGAFQSGNELNVTVSNSATNSSSGAGTNNVGQINATQAQFNDDVTIGDHGALTITNDATTTATGTLLDFTGYLNDQQLYVDGEFLAGDQLSLTVTNTGHDNSTGPGGGQTSMINSNSGTTGDQALFNDIFTVGDGAEILVQNTGTASGAKSSQGVSVAGMNLGQLEFGGAFHAGDDLDLTVSNSGTSTNTGVGGDIIASISTNQLGFDAPVVIGNNGVVTVTNNGDFSGNNSTTYDNVGSVGGSQLSASDNVQAGDGFQLHVENTAVDSSSGSGSSYIGAVIFGQQAALGGHVTVGDDAIFLITNDATSSASGTAGDNVGSLMGAGDQLRVSGPFQAGDGLSLTMTNAGHDNSTNGGGYVGFINDNAASTELGNQAYFHDTFTVGDDAIIIAQNTGTASGTKSVSAALAGITARDQISFAGAFHAGDSLNISATNTGTDSGAGVGGNSVGTVGHNQLEFGGATVMGNNTALAVSNSGNYSGNTANANRTGSADNQLLASGNVQAGDGFHLEVTNTGTNSGTGADGHYVGIVNSNQADFLGSLTLGNDATISVSNSGTNSSASITNLVGYVNINQLSVTGAFTAGTNLNLSVTNTANNTGDVNNSVGYVSGSQAAFQDTVSLGADTIISATNSGIVNSSQLYFAQGFTVSSGKATIEATNTGTATYGIMILGASAGGNAVIVLQDASLVADTSLSTFTIGGLDGDSTSTAQSHADLIIDTDSTTTADFAGVIEDFTATTSTLTKEGAGTQILSGANTYTGLTTVADGMLILSGSVAGDVTVDSGATLSTGNTSGTSTVAGNLVNHGTVSVGIPRTLAVGSFDTTPTDGSLSFAAGSTSGNLTTGHIDTGSTAANLSHQAISINYSGGLIDTSSSSLIATGTGAATAPTADVTDSSFLYDFSVEAGTGGSNNNLYLVADTGTLADLADNGNNLRVSQVLLSDLATTSDATILDIQNALGNAPTREAYNHILSATLPTLNNGAAGSARSFTTHILDLAGLAMGEVAGTPHGISSGDVVSQGLHYWLQGFGQGANQSGEGDIAGYNATTFGGAIGVDTANIDKNNLLGLSLAFGQSHVFGEDVNHSYTNVDSYQLTLYGNHALEDNYFLTGMAALGWDENSNTRYDVGGVGGPTADADYDSWQGAARAEVGRHFTVSELGHAILTPTLSADYLHYDAQSYTETGAGGAGLRVDGMDENLLNLGIGARAQWALQTASGLRFDPEIRASYQYDVLNSDKADTTASFTAGGTTFSTRGLNPSNSTFDVGAGVKLYGKQGWDLTARYDLTLRPDYTANSGILRAAYHF